MTIKEFSQKHGVSTQAIYQRIKSSGIQLESLKQANSQELSENGVAKLSELFAKKQSIDYNALQIENSFLKQRIADLEADRDSWKAAAEQAQQIANQAQALNLGALSRLPASGESIWKRIFFKK